VVANARRTELPLPSPPDDGLHLSLLAAGPIPNTPYWVGAGALAILSIALFLMGRSSSDASSGVPEIWSPASSSGPAAGSRAIQATPAGLPASSMGRIGRYDLLKTIGLGGMAQVYLARATGDGGFAKVLALKVLQPEFASQPEVVQHFLDEAQLVARLDHPNIVQTVDLGRAGDHYFIAMEYVDGADLSRLIEMSHQQRTPVPLPVALAILRRLCDGLHAAHTARADDDTSLGLVHRDVKSANVFVARSGAVKIGDFGIAKAVHPSRIRRTEIGLVKGTPGYMAPEHRLGQSIDGRADLYGVGAIAYELLTGAPVNLDLAILAQKGRDGWPHLPALSSLRADIPPQLETIVMKALSYEPDERFSDCAALESALEAVANLAAPPASDKTIAGWIRTVLDAVTPRTVSALRSSS
jgi:eukaryotic-like serine/threonine-protein kinase